MKQIIDMQLAHRCAIYFLTLQFCKHYTGNKITRFNELFKITEIFQSSALSPLILREEKQSKVK